MGNQRFVSMSFFLREDTPLYGGVEGKIKFDQTSSIQSGHTSNNLYISFPNHSCTHIDFPYHFSNSGKKSHEYESAFWVFMKVGFIDCDISKIEEAIENLAPDIEMLIFKSGFGSKRSDPEYWSSQPVIPARLANVFKVKFPNLRVFGFDLISLTSKLNRDEGKAAHISFLIDNDILIIEDMNLQNIYKAPSSVIVSPLQIYGADGAPCNIIGIY